MGDAPRCASMMPIPALPRTQAPWPMTKAGLPVSLPCASAITVAMDSWRTRRVSTRSRSGNSAS